jgi:hypothetical protein
LVAEEQAEISDFRFYSGFSSWAERKPSREPSPHKNPPYTNQLIDEIKQGSWFAGEMEYSLLKKFLSLQHSPSDVEAGLNYGNLGSVWVNQYMAEQPEDAVDEDGSPFDQTPFVEEFQRKSLTWRAMLASSSNTHISSMASKLPVLLSIEGAF